MRYKFNGRYEATLQLAAGNVAVVAAEGDVQELDDDVAEAVLRDCPDIIEAVDDAKSGARDVEAPPSDRMERGRRRRDREGDPGDAGVMTTADHQAVVKK